MTGLGQVGALGRLGAPALARGGWWLSGSALDLDFANNRTYNSTGNVVSTPASTLTVVRASAGSYFDSAGVLRQAANNALRLDHDPVTLAPLGVLVEEQRTNLLLRSQELATSPWSSSGVGGTTVTVNTSTAPDGTTTADTVTFGASDSGYRFQAITFAASTAYTMSVWAKTASGTKAFRFKLYDGSANPISGDQTATTAWQRFTYSFTSAAGAGVGDLGLVNETAGTAGDVIFWGAQIEAGAFPTSYIPTVASQVTRAADQVSILTSAFGYNSAAGTVFVDANSGTVAIGNNRRVWALSDGTLNNAMDLRQSGSTTGITNITVAGVSQGALSSAMGASVNAAFAYALNDFAMSIYGAAVVTDVSGTVPGGITTFGVGIFTNVPSRWWNGHIARLTYWNIRKTNAELQALSA